MIGGNKRIMNNFTKLPEMLCKISLIFINFKANPVIIPIKVVRPAS